ncbi:YqeB family protein [Saccharopolyspora sp. 5N708]|uniref:YqeB family protein n=1 Tax=Saccharopolyspora sp. 5N708 TaxID=3457424 RepID=UPI003FD0C998
MAADPDATTVAEHAFIRRGSWIFCPLLGALVVFLLRLVSTWVAALPWAPFQGVFELAASAPDPWGTVGAIAIGAIIGVGFAGLMAQERLAVTVSAQQVALAVGRSQQHVERAGIGSVFVDGKHLVLLDDSGAELVRQKSDLDKRSLRRAFTEHRYPWRDKDPFAGHYSLWVEDTPELSLRINTLLAARDRALRKRDGKEAALLRTELANRGILVRDERKRQYWRATS